MGKEEKILRTSFSIGELVEPTTKYKGDRPKYTNKKSQATIKLEAYLERHNKFLGTSKAGADYEMKKKNSMERYRLLQEMRGNLYAIVLPAGHGKTYLSHRYGFVDVDYLIDESEHEYYSQYRIEILVGKNTWGGHNTEWYERLNQTLDLLDYSRPVVLLVHHEETALEVGAMVLGGVVLDEQTFLSNIEGRKRQSVDGSQNLIAWQYSIGSYQSTKALCGSMTNMLTADSNEMLEQQVLSLLNANNMPVAAPYKYTFKYKNHNYTGNVPMWILRGEVRKETDISELVRLYESGDIPKECVDYYVKHTTMTAAYGFGVTMLDWVKVLCKMPPKMNSPKDIVLGGDLLELYPSRSVKEMARANITMRRLQETFDIFSYPEIANVCKAQVGAPQVFVASIISHWIGLGIYTKAAHIIQDWYRIHYLHWTKLMKDTHTLIRTSRFLMNTELDMKDKQALMYMDLLIGRAEYIINEINVVTERYEDSYDSKHLSYDADKDMYTREQYQVDFSEAVQVAFSRVRFNPRKVNVSSFMEYYEIRKTWLTKGSLVYNKIEGKKKDYKAQLFDSVYHTVSEIQNRHNKQSFFEVHELMDAIGDLKFDDFNVTKTMIKYEVGGKERVLLPGSLGHYIIFTYVLTLAERQQQIGSVRLNSLPDDEIIYFDRKMQTGVHHVLYDWADFNEQHTAQEMAGVIEVLHDLAGKPKDYSMFVGAIVESMYNIQLQDKEGKRHKLWRGLDSGWRGTTWINSYLNFVYAYIGLLNIERLYGVNSLIYVDHGGDDIDITFDQSVDCERFLKVMNSMLFDANKWKQMIGYESEFFRNTISNQRVYASPTRALASFVAGDWEGAGNATIVERVQSLLDQIGKLERRGVSQEYCSGAVMCAVSHWTRVKEGEEWLSLPKTIIHGRLEDNGLGVPDSNGEVWVLKDKVPKLQEDWVKKIVPDNRASRDYVDKLARELGRYKLIIERREELANRFAADAFDFAEKAEHSQWVDLLSFSTKVIGKEAVIIHKTNDELFSLFLEFDKPAECVKKYISVGRIAELEGFLTLNDRKLSKQELVDLISGGEVRVEALDFKGNQYYRRLVPEFIALSITTFCREIINEGVASTEQVEDYFETLCCMCRREYGHML